MNELKLFQNEEFGEVRTIDEDGKVLFCGSDVAKALGYLNPSKALSDHCRCVTKRYVPHPQSKNKKIEMSFITEGDLYRLIASSKLPSAVKFESWVFDEVLPTIRKTGGYIPVDENATDDEIMARALIIAQNTIENKSKLIEEMKPKVINYETFLDSKGDLDFNQFVKSSNLILGRNKFIDFLREEKILRQKPSTEPYQKYIDKGYFNVIHTVKSGTSYSKTIITKSGVDWLFGKCRNEWELIRVTAGTEE